MLHCVYIKYLVLKYDLTFFFFWEQFCGIQPYKSFKLNDSINYLLFKLLCESNNTCFIAYYYGKKKSRRVGRPPGGHSNLEGGVKRRGRRRKRRKQLFVHKKRRSSASVDNTPAGSPQVTRATRLQKSETTGENTSILHFVFLIQTFPFLNIITIEMSEF